MPFETKQILTADSIAITAICDMQEQLILLVLGY